MKVVITNNRDNKDIPTEFLTKESKWVSIANKQEFAKHDLTHTTQEVIELLSKAESRENLLIAVDMSVEEFNKVNMEC